MSDEQKPPSIPGSINRNVHPSERKRDWMGGSFVRLCVACRKTFFARDGDEACRQCHEEPANA